MNGNMKNEDTEKYSKEADNEEIKECWTATHTLTAIGFWVFALVYAMRVNLSVAIVAMKDEFDWDEKTKGTILGAFFYGYIFTNFLGGRAAELFGGRRVTALALMLTAAMTLITPIAARYSTPLFIAVRVVEGLAEGVCFPAVNYLLSKWVPNSERARTSTRIYTGNLFGTFATLPICGWLSASTFLGGWPSVFYTTGFFGMIVGILFYVLITDDPKDMKGISKNELRHIQKYCITEDEEKPTFPWKSIATSKQFWTIALIHTGTNWGFYMLLTQMPTYINEILDLPIHTVGMIAGLTYFASWVSSIIYSTILTKLILNKKVTITKGRRISMFISAYGCMLAFVCLLFVTSNVVAAIFILIVSACLYSPHYSGMMCSPSDIAPNFAGSLMGISNTIATIPGFMAPMVVGFITFENQTVWAWRYVFIITIVIYIVFATPYIVYYKADILPWNYPQQTSTIEQKEKEISESNTEFGIDNAAFDTKL